MQGWILVTDADADVRMELFRLLEHEGHHATVVDTGPAALELLRVEPFDLALVDLALPGRQGLALVEAVKADPALRHIPLLVTSAEPDMSDVSRCLEMGAEDYVAKPVDPLVLGARVRSGLTKKRLHDLEAKYDGQLRRVAEALAGIGEGAFDPSDLEHMARRSDPGGRLARAVLQVAGQVRLREQQLRDEIDALLRRIDGPWAAR